uniref:Uncharacterized protein n=1 Tax=Micrurus corallinus TaxID=54390 RepID=A0A2D4GVP9_MICCO
MTSFTTTTVKTGKKPITATAIPSPSTQRSIEGMFTRDKRTSVMNVQTIQAALLSIQETMIKLQENMTRNHGEMKIEMEEMKREVRNDIQKLDEKVGLIQEVLPKKITKDCK